MISKSVVEKIILTLLVLQIVVDTLQGFISLKIGLDIGISQVYKIIFFSICFLYVSAFTDDKLYLVLLLSISCVLILTSHVFRQKGVGVLLDLSEYIKLITTFFVFSAITNFSCTDPFRFLHQLSKIVILVLIFNVVISILGLGTFAYGDYGLKGFFYAANAVSGVIAIASGVIFSLSVHRSKYFYLLVGAICLFLAAAIGTKSGILSVLFLFFIIPYLNGYNFKSIFIFSLSSLCLILFSTVIFESITDSGFGDRISYFYESGGISRAILSDRDVFLFDIIPHYLSANLFDVSFGLGFGYLNNLNKPLVEIDPIDVIFIYGALGMVVYMISMVYILILLLRIRRQYIDSSELRLLCNNSLITSLVLFLTASVAGHVLFNGMVTAYWGVILAVPFWYVKYKKSMNLN